MTIMNKNLMPSIKENLTLDINSNDQTKKTIRLSHTINLRSKCRGVRSVNVTSDNRFLIITYESGEPRIRTLDLEKLEFLPYKYTGHTDSVRLTSITRNNKAFYTASWDGSSRRFELESGNCTQIFSGFGRSPSCFIDPEEKLLFTASYDSDIDIESKNAGRCWNLSSGKTIQVYKHKHERIDPGAIDIVYDEGKVYTGSDDGFAYQWNVKSERPVFKYFSFKGSVRKIAVSANYFAAACTDGLVRVHYKSSGECFRYFLHSEEDVREVRISKDETKLWSATDNGSVSCFNLMTGELIYHRKIHSLWIWSVCLMRDDKILVTGSGDGSIAFLSADSGQVLAQLMNIPWGNDTLIICPPDKVFPTGFFYTTNRDFVQVIKEDEENHILEFLDLNDPGCEAYINKLNLKNLIIMRLKNNRQYTSLTDHYIQNQILLNQVSNQKVPHSLKA
jgi:WD40 repeat protein